MRFRFSDNITLQQVFNEMDKIRKMGFECHLEGCGDGGIELVIRIMVIKPKDA